MTAMPPNFDPLRFCVQPRVTAQERQQWIATAAYFKAQRRGFTPGQEARTGLRPRPKSQRWSRYQALMGFYADSLDDAQVTISAIAKCAQCLLIFRTIVCGDRLRDAVKLNDDRALFEARFRRLEPACRAP